MAVRETTLDAVEHVLAMYESVAAEGRWIGREVPFDLDAARERITSTTGAAGHHSTVAELTTAERPELYGGLVGHLHLGVAPYGVAELGMHVAFDHRGQGVGRALLDEAIAWARAEPGVHKIALQVWPHNEAAQALYLSSGFVQEGYLTRHYRRHNGELWDCLVMGLLL